MANPPNIDADLAGSGSPPRNNGEIVFGAPWERRVFGLTVAACRSGACDWESFRKRLIWRIADDEMRPYWQNWAAALEDVLEHAAVLTPGELDDRHHELLRRPTGFDHHR
ncbi:MAG: nitrile hydratase accessory protein [Mycobacterium sp.]